MNIYDAYEQLVINEKMSADHLKAMVVTLMAPSLCQESRSSVNMY